MVAGVQDWSSFESIWRQQRITVPRRLWYNKRSVWLSLAVNFDLNNAVGFVSNYTTPANTYCTNNVACLAPAFTVLGQNVRGLPNVIVPARLNFPNLQPADNSRRIETSFDAKLKAPINYSWNFTYERSLPKGLFIQASYIGRYANNLIAN